MTATMTGIIIIDCMISFYITIVGGIEWSKIQSDVIELIASIILIILVQKCYEEKKWAIMLFTIATIIKSVGIFAVAILIIAFSPLMAGFHIIYCVVMIVCCMLYWYHVGCDISRNHNFHKYNKLVAPQDYK